MDYIPVYEGEAAPETAAPAGTVRIAPEKQQLLGVRTEAAAERELRRTVRAVGTIQPNERLLYRVTLRFEGWIERLVRQYDRTARRSRPAAHGGVQPGARVRTGGVSDRSARGRADARERDRGAGRHAASHRERVAADAQFRRLRRGAGYVAQGRQGPVDPNLSLSGRRRRDPEAERAGHALHAGRAALRNRRPVERLAGRRRVRARPWIHQAGPGGDAQDRRLSREDLYRQSRLRPADARCGDPDCPRARRAAQRRRPAEAGDVRRGRVFHRRSARQDARRPRVRRARQRGEAGGAGPALAGLCSSRER